MKIFSIKCWKHYIGINRKSRISFLLSKLPRVCDMFGTKCQVLFLGRGSPGRILRLGVMSGATVPNAFNLPSLPVDAVIPDLKAALRSHGSAVLQAPPGAGKTTRIPPALLSEPWLENRKIILLSPRRLAARAAAEYMAAGFGEAAGERVGYRMRMESRVSARTRIEVVTEGVLTRMLQTNSDLSGVGLVIFDEFHERSLDADLGLALCLDIRDALNPDLHLLVMSATLMTEPVAALMGNAPVITCAGRAWPVQLRYLPGTPQIPMEKATADAVLTAIRNEEGSILVFLPGTGEIRKVARLLSERDLPAHVMVAPLYGNLSRPDQQKAIAPAPGGQRKIVLASAIAETSLTIEGIRVVIDSGLSRLPCYDAGSGMTRLVTLPVSQASADQRCGRAGRTEPGVCYRLWPEALQSTLPAFHRPEIQQADLSDMLLNLSFWGINDPLSLRWLDPPPPAAVSKARDLVCQLGALDQGLRPTPKGLKMAALPVHPRLAAMLLDAAARNQAPVACDLAAILSERDPIRFPLAKGDADLRLRLQVLQLVREGKAVGDKEMAVDFGLCRRIIKLSGQLLKRVGSSAAVPRSHPPISLGALLALAYPDRIAQKRPAERGRFLMANGRGAILPADDPLADRDYLVVAELDGDRRDARVFLAADYSEEMILTQFEAQLQRSIDTSWDPIQKSVKSVERIMLGALSLKTRRVENPDPEKVAEKLLGGIRQEGIEALPWSDSLGTLKNRVALLRRLFPDQKWPDFSDAGLTDGLETWLGPHLYHMSRLKDLGRLDLGRILKSRLDRSQQEALEALAPTHWVVPSGSRIPIDYSAEIPVLRVRLQELFGCRQTPAVAAGRQPLVLHLLSPAGRPVQVTMDLAGFWQGSYQEVKKALKGRYPKHEWPDDPISARPTARAKPRKKP